MQTEAIIIGSGAIGLEAAAVLKRNGICYLHFDAGQIGETFLKWPRQTIFYSTSQAGAGQSPAICRGRLSSVSGRHTVTQRASGRRRSVGAAEKGSSGQ